MSLVAWLRAQPQPRERSARAVARAREPARAARALTGRRVLWWAVGAAVGFRQYASQVAGWPGCPTIIPLRLVDRAPPSRVPTTAPVSCLIGQRQLPNKELPGRSATSASPVRCPGRRPQRPQTKREPAPL